MNDRDQSLQDQFDRYYRGNGAPPDTGDDPEAAAYQTVFSALHEEPDGDLPADFAEQVADRVGVGKERTLLLSDVFLLFLVVAGLGATIVAMPSVSTVLQETVWVLLRSVQSLSTYVRLDVVGGAGLVLVLTAGLDALVRRFVPLRRAPSPS